MRENERKQANDCLQSDSLWYTCMLKTCLSGCLVILICHVYTCMEHKHPQGWVVVVGGAQKGWGKGGG